MKCLIPEIFWHNRDPVLSVDIQPKPLDGDDKIRLASAGMDSHVLIWYIGENEDGLPQLDFASDLTRHIKPVNIVRWSPSGQYLASGADDSTIYIWKIKAESDGNLFDDSSDQNKEVWITYKILRGHVDDILDLSWSLDSQFLASGEIGCKAIIWDVMKGKCKFQLHDHKNFVQGVAWDPKDKFLATMSADRTLRLFDSKSSKVLRRYNKSAYPVDGSSPFYNKKIRLFHDDTLQTFFRRLTYTPDGSLLIVPSGCTDVIASSNETHAAQNESKESSSIETPAAQNEGKENKADNADVTAAIVTEVSNSSKDDVGEKVEKSEKTDKPIKQQNTSYIFTRYSKEPAVVIPSPDHFTVAVRCCPTIFKLKPHNENNPPVIDLPYRMIYAIASKSSIYLYDTQQRLPFGSISNIHYSRLTDISWSNDGKILIVSSFDGFCTLIAFDDGELGEVYDEPISFLDSDDKNGQTKKKRNSTDKQKSSPKEQKGDPSVAKTAAQKGDGTMAATIVPTTCNDMQMVKPKIEIPETIIATTETFESPELKEKQATPIAIRRAPRTTPSTSSSSTGATPKSSEPKGDATANAKKPKLIAIRRQPRNILPIDKPSAVEKSATDQDEALDAWPIPIDIMKSNIPETGAKSNNVGQTITSIGTDNTEDMRLVYEGESESTLMKIEMVSTPKPSESKSSTNERQSEDVNISEPLNGEQQLQQQQQGTPDTKNQKTPRRVQFRTISTPKSKKKLIN